MKKERDDLVMWQGRKVMLLLPTYKSINPDTHHSLFANYAKYGPDKIGVELQSLTMIHESRNILIDRAMKTDAETFIMCDDDMILPVGNEHYFNTRHGAGVPAKFAERLAFSRIMSHGRDRGIIGALYVGRHKSGKAQCSDGFNDAQKNKELHLLKHDGLIPMQWVATGFIKIERWAIEKLRDAIDDGRWPDLKEKAGQGWKGYFNPMGVGVGEDCSFGVRCQELGIQSYLDAGLVCLHVGSVAFSPANTSY